MTITRRSLLKRTVAAVAVVVTPLVAAGAAVPRIVGDGVHDDAEGFRALLRGDPVDVENECVKLIAGYDKGGPLLQGGWDVEISPLGTRRFPGVSVRW